MAKNKYYLLSRENETEKLIHKNGEFPKKFKNNFTGIANFSERCEYSLNVI